MWRKSTQAWEKESTVIQRPVFTHPWLECHPCPDLHAKAGMTLTDLPALPQVKPAPLSLPWSRGVGSSGQAGNSPGILSMPVTRRKAQRSLWFLPCELGNSHVVAAFLLLRLGDDSGQPRAIPFSTSYTRQSPKLHLVPAPFLAPGPTPS